MEAHEHKPSGLVYAKRTPNPRWKSGYLFIWKPHEPKGAAQFRELWVAIPQEKRDQVFKWWFHENPPATLADREDFMTWVFKNPDEACQIIFEVTGGKEK